MFRPMRRHVQQLPEAEALAIIEQETAGVLALAGDNDYPYAVPLSHVLSGRTLYFHCAKEGHKADAVHRQEKCSYCVIAQDDIVPEELTTYYRSAIAFGRVRFLTDREEIRHALELLAEKFAKNFREKAQQEIEESLDTVGILALEIEHLTGKEAIELRKKHT